jgi:hypothetical protein
VRLAARQTLGVVAAQDKRSLHPRLYISRLARSDCPMPDPEPQGLCQTGWFPSAKWHSETEPQREHAKRICARCPLLTPCRRVALHEFVLGFEVRVVIGGMTETEIREYRREHRITAPRAINPIPPKAKILDMPSDSDPAERAARGALTRVHREGGHDDWPRAACPLCSAITAPE